jgi:muramoyltetrapeptide carboxypeptidase
LAGIVFGQCTSYAATAPDYAGFALDQLVDHHCAP